MPEAGAPPPAGFGLRLDPSVRRVDGGRVLIGGHPLRVMRLTGAGADLVQGWAGGRPVGGGAAAGLARRLLSAGLAHPVPGPATLGPGSVTLVIPARGRPAGVANLLGAAGRAGMAAAVVVDDGSEPADGAALARACSHHGAALVVHPRPLGPAAARNRGAAEAATPAIAFLDTDCRWPAGSAWLDTCLAHLGDPAVGLVGPRVRAAPGRAPRWLAAYESVRSPLDLGPEPALVRPGGPVAYLPAAALVVRREAFCGVGGFRADLEVGEDVDLVWRLGQAGWECRYEPAAVVEHETRPRLGTWAHQRFRYGTSAALLDAAHPGAVAPLAVSGWTGLAWGLAATGHPVAGAGVAAATTGLLAPRLSGLDHPWREAVRLAGRGHLGAWRPLADAVRRAWWPLGLAAALGSRRARRLVVAAALVPPLVEAAGGVPLDPLRWAALRMADDLSYGAGLWAGVATTGRVGALLPRFSSWPGRRDPGGRRTE